MHIFIYLTEVLGRVVWQCRLKLYQHILLSCYDFSISVILLGMALLLCTGDGYVAC